MRQISESKINEGSIEELYGGFNFDNHIQLGKDADAQDKYIQSIQVSNLSRTVLLSKTPEAIQLYKQFNKTMMNTLVGVGRVFSFYLQKKVNAEIEIFTKSNDKINAFNLDTLTERNSDYVIQAPNELTFEPYKIEVLEGSSLDYSIKHCKFYNQTIFDAVVKMKNYFPDLAPDVNK